MDVVIIGPGFGWHGPFGSYIRVPITWKLLMIVLMWFGRLEGLTATAAGRRRAPVGRYLSSTRSS
jgi:Trk-type K+ transport system membrane component